MRTRISALATKRAFAVAAAVVALAAVAVGAYAQFTGSGGSAGTDTSPGIGVVTVSSPPVGPLSPQINPQDTTRVTVTVNNTAGDGVYVAQITGAVATHGGCQSAWFTVSPIVPGTISPGVHTFSSAVVLNDNDGDQTACLAAPVTIEWTARNVPLPPPASKPQVGSFGPGR